MTLSSSCGAENRPARDQALNVRRHLDRHHAANAAAQGENFLPSLAVIRAFTCSLMVPTSSPLSPLR